MKNIKWMSLALVAVFAVACDPYDDAKGGTPQVRSIFASSQGDLVEATPAATAGAWIIEDAGSFCRAATTGTNPLPEVVTATQPLIFVALDRQMDPTAVQSSVDDCTPTGGWLTGTPAPADMTWYACYSPASPTPAEGASIVLFLAPTPTDNDTPADPSDDILAPSGWDAAFESATASFTPTSGDVVTPYTLTGSVLEGMGVTGITVNFAPDPGTVDVDRTSAAVALTFSGVSDTAVTVGWAEAVCGTAGVTTYKVERAPNVANDPVDTTDDAPGTFAVVAEGLTGLTFADTGLTPGTKYWYRVRAVTSTEYEGAAVRQAVTTTGTAP